MRRSIRIQPDEPGDKLEAMSRIDYFRSYTVEHNVKAMAFGYVHKDSEKQFFYDFKDVVFGDEGGDEDDDGEESSSEEGQDPEEGDSDATRVPNNQGKTPAAYISGGTGSSSRSATQVSYQQGQLPASNPSRQGLAMRSVSDQRVQSTQQAWSQAQAQAQAQMRLQVQQQQQQEVEQPEQQRQEQQRQEQQRQEQQRAGASSRTQKERGSESSKKTKR